VDPRGTAWATSGAMVLTGRADGPPLGAPSALVDLIDRAATTVRQRSSGRMTVDGLALLGERAALSNLWRQSPTSCGGSTRLLPAADGWIAVSLARPDDVAALSAWLDCEVPLTDVWPVVTEAAAAKPCSLLDDRAALLGLPFAALGSIGPPTSTSFELPVQAVQVREPGDLPRPIEGATVVDLSSLWAGPLCGQLLAGAGANVIKVESTARPDGARRGPESFFNLLNGQKRSVVLDPRTAGGRLQLRRLVTAADVVIESARPRALEQMGIDATKILGDPRGPSVWASITSHGRSMEQGQRVGFGDVAAVAGGLVAEDGGEPCFLADAVTDPLSGLVTAAAVLEALSRGGHWLIDSAMAPLAASAAGAPLDVTRESAQLPRAREVVGPAPPMGSDTTAVLSGLTA
jgi:hypothetical protein